jgi:hypothetical protein
VIVLDEVDQLDETDVLYDLYRIPDLTTTLIANREEELFAEFDSRVRSRLTSSTRVHFDSYHLDESWRSSGTPACCSGLSGRSTFGIGAPTSPASTSAIGRRPGRR